MNKKKLLNMRWGSKKSQEMDYIKSSNVTGWELMSQGDYSRSFQSLGRLKKKREREKSETDT